MELSSLLTEKLVTWMEREVNKSLHVPCLLRAPFGAHTR